MWGIQIPLKGLKTTRIKISRHFFYIDFVRKEQGSSWINIFDESFSSFYELSL